MVKDALVTSHPVSPKLNHPDEIAESFDQISYNKVNCYLNHFMFTCLYFANFVFEYVLNKGYPLEAKIIHKTNNKSRGWRELMQVRECIS